MHTKYKFYYFIESFNFKELSNIKKSINIIFRKGFKLYLSNNINLAIKLKLDGVYLPSFNKKLIYKNFNSKKRFKIIGSAHNIPEIKIKEKQNCEEIFLSPIFKTEKHRKYLDIVKFNLQALATDRNIIALGGVNTNNLNRINLTKSKGVASISWIKKNGLK
jgi:thiamine-phosphate pyrophosphorylase